MILLRALLVCLFIVGLVGCRTPRVVPPLSAYTNRSAEFVYWLSADRIARGDFAGDTNNLKKDSITYNNALTLGLKSVASTGIHSVLDVPASRSDRGRLLEKMYIAPAFCRRTSCMFSYDSVDMAKQILIFDLAELATRTARRNVQALRDAMPHTYGALYFRYQTIVNDAKDLYFRSVIGYTEAVLVTKSDSAFYRWREVVNKALIETSEFATSKEDAFRLLTDEPTDADYEKSETIARDMKKRDSVIVNPY